MRIVICCMALLATSVLIGCGQTGALQLPSDANYDKRAQYMLYKGATQSSTQPEPAASSKAEEQSNQHSVTNDSVIKEPADQKQISPDSVTQD